MNPLAIKAGFGLALLALAFGSGWRVRGAFEAEAEAAAAVRQAQDKISGQLEAKLAELRANERIIERETQRVIEKPVYRTVCADADGLRVLEAARTGGKPSDEMPAAPQRTR